MADQQSVTRKLAAILYADVAGYIGALLLR